MECFEVLFFLNYFATDCTDFRRLSSKLIEICFMLKNLKCFMQGKMIFH